jgi:hypothetical protein
VVVHRFPGVFGFILILGDVVGNTFNLMEFIRVDSRLLDLGECRLVVRNRPVDGRRQCLLHAGSGCDVGRRGLDDRQRRLCEGIGYLDRWSGLCFRRWRFELQTVAGRQRTLLARVFGRPDLGGLGGEMGNHGARGFDADIFARSNLNPGCV